jgi:hypothetical protein
MCPRAPRSRNRPEIIFPELRATRTAAGVTLLTEFAITELVSAEAAADIARDVFVEANFTAGFRKLQLILFHISTSHHQVTRTIGGSIQR